MELLSVIRRWAFRDQLSIREISRRTHLSRNTIRKYLRSDVVEVKFKVANRASKLDAFADKLSGWLKTEASKPRKQKRTLKQLHADIVALGFTGSYGRVAAFSRAWKWERQREQQTAGRGAFIPLVFQPGEAFQFDSHGDLRVKGCFCLAWANHVRLAAGVDREPVIRSRRRNWRARDEGQGCAASAQPARAQPASLRLVSSSSIIVGMSERRHVRGRAWGQ